MIAFTTGGISEFHRQGGPQVGILRAWKRWELTGLELRQQQELLVPGFKEGKYISHIFPRGGILRLENVKKASQVET